MISSNHTIIIKMTIYNESYKTVVYPDIAVGTSIDPDADNVVISYDSETKIKIIMSIIFATCIVCMISLTTFVIFIIITELYSDPLPEKLNMIVTINTTGAYVEYEKCHKDALDCQTEKYLIVDKDYDQFDAYCVKTMNRPIIYKINDIIPVAYNSNTLAHHSVLYGCKRSFVSYRGYIFWQVYYGSLSLLIISSAVMMGCVFAFFAVMKCDL